MRGNGARVERKRMAQKESNVISFPFEGRTQKKCYKRIQRFRVDLPCMKKTTRTRRAKEFRQKISMIHYR